jgi:hypothetical protein
MFKKIKHFSCKVSRSRYSHCRVNGDNKNINAIRVGILAQIHTKHQEIIELREQLKRLNRVDKESEPFVVSSVEYRNIGLTAAIIHAVNALHSSNVYGADGVSATQVRDFLLAHGFNNQPQDFDVAVHVTLARLAKRPNQRILVSLESGKKRYKPNKDFGNGSGR